MFTCLVEELQYALSAIGPTVGTESNGHAGIRIKTHKKNDRVKLTSTEGAFSTEVWIDAKVKGQIDMVIEGERFIKYVAKLDAKEAKLEMEKGKLVLESTRGKPTFFAYSPDTFPELPKIEADFSFSLAGKVFKKLVGGVAFATKTEKKGSVEAPMIEGINIESTGKRLIFTTMNGYVIASCKKTVETNEMNVTAAKKSIVNAAKLVGDSDKVTIQINPSQVIVKHNDITYYIPVYAGAYPTMPVQKKDFMTSFTLVKEELLGVLERGASMLEDSGTTKGILQTEKGKVTLSGNTQRNDFLENIVTTIEGKKASVKIDLKRMSEILKNIDADNVTIGINNGKPISIRPDGRTDHTCLLAIG